MPSLEATTKSFYNEGYKDAERVYKNTLKEKDLEIQKLISNIRKLERLLGE